MGRSRQVFFSLTLPAVLVVLVTIGCGGPIPDADSRLPMKKAPPSAKELLERGNRLYEAGRYDEARACYGEIIKAAGNGVDCDVYAARFNRGLAFQAEGRFREAAADFTAVVDGNERDGAALFRRGQCHEGNREYEKAVADYSKALSIDSKDTRLYLVRGHAYRKWGRRYDAAVTDFLCAASLDPMSGEAYYALGMTYFMRADYQKAVESLSRAILIDPEDGKSYNGRGQSLLQQGRRTKALADFRKACELREKAGCIMLTYLNGQGKKTGNRDGGKALDARP